MEFLSPILGYVLNFLYNTTNNYGVAIMVFALLLRLILIPLTIKQQKSMKKSAKLQEKLKVIQEKYKSNPEKLNQETMNLYKTEKMSPFTGCLSGILQILIILSVFFVVSKPLTHMVKIDKSVIEKYQNEIKTEDRGNYPEIKIISKVEEEYQEVVKLINEKSKNDNTTTQTENENSNSENEENTQENAQDDENKENTQNEEKAISEMTLEELENKKSELEKMRINMNFLGLDLSEVPSQNLGDWRVYIIPVLYVITSFVSIKITTSAQKKEQKKKENVITEDGKPANQTDEMAESMNQMSNTMLYMMPIMSISIAAIAPLGLALYWLVSNILMIIERLVINKFIKSEEEE